MTQSLVVSQAPPHPPLCTWRSMSSMCSLLSPQTFITANPLLLPFSNNPTPKFITTTTTATTGRRRRRRSSNRPFYHVTLAKAEESIDNSTSTSTTPSSSSSSSSSANDQTVFVGGEDVPLEGVIQFEKPTSSSRFQNWGRVALLAGVDVLALLLFASIGRYSHGLSILDIETLRTADPFIAGWFLGAYFLGGYGEDGRGMKGLPNGVIATAKSWAIGIPIGIAIRAATSGHLPNYGFVFVSLGSTAVLLISFRALLYTILAVDNRKKSDDVYRRGSPFELFELLTSLVRRW